jgi:hypothetical protein
MYSVIRYKFSPYMHECIPHNSILCTRPQGDFYAPPLICYSFATSWNVEVQLTMWLTSRFARQRRNRKGKGKKKIREVLGTGMTRDTSTEVSRRRHCHFHKQRESESAVAGKPSF